jgi:hypothetical protein
MVKHHIIISGTGRAGTTFLVQLLTVLGLDTGFDSPTSGIFPNCNAGMELDARQPNAPYIIKSPWLCDYLDDLLRDGRVVIDHAIIPIRDLYAAAESRRFVARKVGPVSGADQIPGGLWHTTSPDAQEAVLTHQLYKLLFAVAKHDIPVAFLHFPRFVTDPEYLYRKIGSVINGLDYAEFLKGFRSVSRPDLVHEFRARESDTVEPLVNPAS